MTIDGDDMLNTQFSRLLDQHIHAGAATDPLQQGDGQWRLRFSLHAVSDGDGNLITFRAGDVPPVIKAVAVEQVQFGIVPAAQGLANMCRTTVGQGYGGTRAQRPGMVDSRYHHRIIESGDRGYTGLPA